MRTSVIEEIFNSITHGIGAILGVMGLGLLLLLPKHFTVMHLVIFSLFLGSLIIMYIMSTLSHSLMFTKAKKVFLILDRSSIFLFIAGTYTSLILFALHGTIVILLLSIIWILAILGIVLSVVFLEKIAIVAIALYLVMGWFALFVIKLLFEAMPIHAFVLLVIGGILYTGGLIFYTKQKMFFSHTIWHLFVLFGSICHFFSLYLL